jgi:hypothetical protein
MGDGSNSKAAKLPALPEYKPDESPDSVVFFDYPGARQARNGADSRAKLSGLDPTIFVIAERDGRYAVVPNHLAAAYNVVDVATAPVPKKRQRKHLIERRS